jgi:hypothetical protein
MEQFEHREMRQSPKQQLPEKEQKGQREKRETRFEAVPEQAGITRKLLFFKPFKIYEDTIDAATENFRGMIDKVPAVYAVIDSDEQHIVIGDERGKRIGLVPKKTLKYTATEWNTYEMNILPKDTEVELSDNAEGTSSRYIRLASETIIAATSETKGEWKKYGPVLKGNLLTEENEPVWIRTHNIENGVNAIAASEIDIKRWISRMNGFVTDVRNLSSEKRKDLKPALDAIQKTTISLLNGYTGRLPASIGNRQRDVSVMADVLNITISDLGRMDDEQFHAWIESIDSLVQTQAIAFDKWMINGKQDGIDLYRGGSKPEKMFLLR